MKCYRKDCNWIAGEKLKTCAQHTVRKIKPIKGYDDVCSICLENDALNYQMHCCKKWFHRDCLVQWFATMDEDDLVKCPLCKQFVKLADKHVIEEFFDACYNGDVATIRNLIDAGVDVHEGDDKAIINACLKGHLTVVQYLVERGANVRASEGGQEDTPLFYACDRGHLNVVQYLLRHGANARDTHSMEAAVKNGHVDVVQCLLESGADVRSTENYFLLDATLDNDIKMAECLLKHGSNVHFSYDRALYYAMFNHKNVAMIELLFKYAPDINSYTGLNHALEKGSSEVVACLKAHGAIMCVN
jgi:ankyrin repeat protein